jgi:hypothetical protein
LDKIYVVQLYAAGAMDSLLIEEQENDQAHVPAISPHMPTYVVHFKEMVLDSPKVLKVYYVCYIFLIAFSIYDFVVYSLVGGGFLENGVLYELFYLLQNIALLAIVPFSIAFLNETLNSNDIPDIVGEATRFDHSLIKRFRVVSAINLVGFLISLVVFFVTKENYVSGTISVILLLITTLPLPFCVSVIVLLLESHRLLAVKFAGRLFSGAYGGAGMHILCSADYSADGIDSVAVVRSEFIRVRELFLRTSHLRGRFISALTGVLFLLLVYLIWTTYLWSVSLLGLLGFIVLVMFIFMELFVCTALANEAGKQVSRGVAEYLLYYGSPVRCGIRALGSSRDDSSDALVAQLVACLNFVTIEIRGVGGLVLDIKLVSTVCFGLVASIVPRLIIKQ